MSLGHRRCEAQGAWVAARRARQRPPLTLRAGETYDFLWTPGAPMDAVLSAGNDVEGFSIRQVLRVR